MAFGFTPKHTQTVSIENLTSGQFIALASETLKKLDWEIAYLSSNGIISYTAKGLFAWKAEFKIIILNGIPILTSSSTGSEFWDMGKNKKKVEEFILAFTKLKNSISFEDIAIIYNQLEPSFAPKKDDILIQPEDSTKNKIPAIFSIFIPTKSFLITPLLIDLNILVFIIMAASGVSILQPSVEDMIKWGGNFRPSTLDGEWWRLLTNCFLHFGIIHLLMNMYALLYIGTLLEPIIGKSRFIFSYLITGIAASTTSIIWHPLTVSAGASGAIFGLYGLFLALLTTDLIEKTTRKALFTSIGIFVFYNLVYGLKGGIDNAAHIGGLVSGIIVGFASLSSLREPNEDELKYKSLIYLSIAVIAFITITYKTVPNDFKTYDEKMNHFATLESMALEPLKDNNTIQLDSLGKPIAQTKEMLLNDIKNRGIYYWNECIKIMEEVSRLRLPSQIQERNKIVLEYCQLRIKVMN